MPSLRRLFWYLLVPGIVLHEFSHAVAVFVSPNARITEVKWTSHVNYETTYSASSTFFISYAPVAIHTGVIAVCILALPETVFTDAWKDIALDVVLVYVSLTVGVAALPSYEDALSPFQLILSSDGRVWKWLYPRSILMILLGTPGLVVTYLCHRSVVTRALLTVIYIGTVVTVALYPTASEELVIHGIEITKDELESVN